MKRSSPSPDRMLYLAEMTVRLPPDMREPALAELKSQEQDVAQRLQQDGRWRHLWRVAGRYANVSVFDESAVEKQAARGRTGSEGTILGPYYLPDAPVLSAPYELPQRPGEPGERLVMTGRVSDVDGAPIVGAVLDVWHADANGLYSG